MYKAAQICRNSRLRSRNYYHKQKKLKSENSVKNFSEKMCSDKNDFTSVSSMDVESTKQLPLELSPNSLENVEDFNNQHRESTGLYLDNFAKECKSSKISDRFSSDDSDLSELDSSDSESVSESNDTCGATNESDLATDLRKWSKKNLISYVHLDELLQILQPYHSDLPSSMENFDNFDSDLEGQMFDDLQQHLLCTTNTSYDLMKIITSIFKTFLSRDVIISFTAQKKARIKGFSKIQNSLDV